jgi:hypothetical protein
VDASIRDCLRILSNYARRHQPIGNGLREMPGGFSGARVWQVETESGRMCLRRTNAASLEQARLLGLHRLLRHVHAAGVTQIPVPVATSAGTTLVHDAGFWWQLDPWMPGTADFNLRPNRHRLESALSCLAQFHRAAATFVPARDESPWFFQRIDHSPGIRERLELLRRWNSELRASTRRKLRDLSWPEFAQPGDEVLDLFERLAEPVSRELRVSSRIAVPLQPCLRDVWHDHVLFTGDTVTGLVDPFACRSDTVATDLARLLTSLSLEDPADWDEGLNADLNVRPLSCDERGLIEVFAVSGTLLGGMTWLDWICLQERTPADRPGVISRFTSIVGRIRALSRQLRLY